MVLHREGLPNLDEESCPIFGQVGEVGGLIFGLRKALLKCVVRPELKCVVRVRVGIGNGSQDVSVQFMEHQLRQRGREGEGPELSIW